MFVGRCSPMCEPIFVYSSTEYESIQEFKIEYGEQYETIEDIEEKTLVIPVTTNKDKNIQSFIIQNF